MEIVNITPINVVRHFTKEEANELVPLLLAITSKTRGAVSGLQNQINFFKAQPGKADALAMQVNQEVSKWSDKIKRLGGNPFELFSVKFITPSGSVLLWTFPDDEVVNA